MPTEINLDSADVGVFRKLIADLNDDTVIIQTESGSVTLRNLFLEHPGTVLKNYGIGVNQEALIEIHKIRDAVNKNNIPTIGVSPPQITGVVALLRDKNTKKTSSKLKVPDVDDLLIS